MIGGIACGIRKRISIFNTSEICFKIQYHFDWHIDIDDMTPIVVAYNNYQYESLEPVEEQDRQETIKLVNSYIIGRYNIEYGFSRLDIKDLISPEDVVKNSLKKRNKFKLITITLKLIKPKKNLKINVNRTPGWALNHNQVRNLTIPFFKFTKENKKNKQKTEQQDKDKNKRFCLESNTNRRN